MKDIYNNTLHADWITEPITETQYAIEETDDSITIKFQGSCSRLDWLQNFSFWKKPYKQMPKIFFVHAGFLKKYKAVSEPIMQAVRLSLVHDKSIKVLGYSQGAALALLCHEDIVYKLGKLKPDVKTYLFGCPRVFGLLGNISDRFEGVARVENGNDIVTRIPFVWMLFRHYGKSVHIGKKRNVFRFSIKNHLTYKENL